MKKREKQRGNAILEFALVSALLFALTFGVVDFARLFTTASLVAGAAAAGTQYGSLSPAHYGDYTGMQNAALQAAGNPSNMTATATTFCTCSIGGSEVTCPANCNTGNPSLEYLQVTVTMPFSTEGNYPGIPSSMSVTRSSVVRVQ